MQHQERENDQAFSSRAACSDARRRCAVCATSRVAADLDPPARWVLRATAGIVGGPEDEARFYRAIAMLDTAVSKAIGPADVLGQDDGALNRKLPGGSAVPDTRANDADFQAIDTIMYGCFTPSDRPPEKGWIFVGKNVSDPGAGKSFSLGDRTGERERERGIYMYC